MESVIKYIKRPMSINGKQVAPETVPNNLEEGDEVHIIIKPTKPSRCVIINPRGNSRTARK